MILNAPSMDLLTLQSHGGDKPRVLACLSMSRRAVGIAAEAWRLARRLDATLHLLHVGPYTTGGRRQLHRMLSAASVPLDDVDLHIAPGMPAEEIVYAAEQLDATVIVAGTLDYGREPWAPSIARRVVQAAAVPVLLVRHPEITERSMDTFVAAVDFDDHSHRMLGWTLDWMRAERATNLFLIHELPSGQAAGAVCEDPESLWATACPNGRAAEVRHVIAGHDTTGLHVHVACLHRKSACDPMLYAAAVRADVLCLPLNDEHLDHWTKLNRHRASFKTCRTTCRLLLHPNTHA